jgi:hypothetical protein
MKPLPLAIIVILTWTFLVIVDNWPRETARAPEKADPRVFTASAMPPAPQLQMTEQPRYRPGR